MTPVPEAKPFTVGDWYVEPELLRISKKGVVKKIEFRTMEILLYLASCQGEVVSKRRLHDEVWKEVFVTDNALVRTVSKLRKALGDDVLNASYITTISKSGYRLIAEVDFNPQSEAGSLNQISNIRKKAWVLAMTGVVLVVVLRIVATSKGDAYSRFYDPTPVSTLIGPETAHDISPDGKKISFTYSEPEANNPDVYVKLLEDFSQINFTNLKSPQGYGIWSPDGNYMAYASAEDGTCGIYKEPSFGGEKVRIGSCYSQPEDFVWSPDGKIIAFTDFESAGESRRIYFLDLEENTCEAVLIPEAGVSHRDPAFSSDGKHLVFRKAIAGQGADIYSLRLADMQQSRLTFDNAKIFGLDVFDEDRQIVFSSNRGGQWALWRLPFEGGAASRLYVNDRVLLEPKVSADDDRLIYKSVSDRTQLWGLDEDTNFQTPSSITSSTRADMHPALSPDGKKLAFISDRSGYFEIWSRNLEDGTEVKLTSLKAGFVNMPSWSADGSEIVFDARLKGNSAIYILDVASKTIRSFAKLGGDQVNAHFSIDGKLIYFASNHSGSWQIWKKPAFDSAGPITQVTTNGGFRLQEAPKTGDLFYVRMDTSGIWRVNSEGEEEHFITGLNSVDWGGWAPLDDGILYLDRSSGPQFFHQPFGEEESPTLIFSPSKGIQFSAPVITASQDKVIFAQIEQSEDETMLVNFQ